jgi:hypothetical protein
MSGVERSKPREVRVLWKSYDLNDRAADNLVRL